MKTVRTIIIGIVLLAIFVSASISFAKEIGPESNVPPFLVKDRPGDVSTYRILSADGHSLPAGLRCYFKWANHCDDVETYWPEAVNR